MICGVYQKISAAFGLSGMRLWNAMVPVMLGFNLCLFMALTRRLGFTLFQGLSLTAVFMATGATITWSVVLETHVLAPTSLLLAALILSHPRLMVRVWSRPSVYDLGAFGLAIALSASITITNAMLGILTALHARSIRRAQPLCLVEQTVRRFPPLLIGGLIAIVASLIASSYLLVIKLMGQDIGNRPLLTLAVVMGLAGIQLFCFGLLGELLIRTYHESQDRPIYRVRATLRGGREG